MYLLLLAVLPVLWWFSMRSLSQLGRWRKLTAIFIRSLVFLLLVAALAEIRIVRTSPLLTVFYLLDQSQSIPVAQRKAMIDSVVVKNGYRHRGIGTVMMQWVLDNLGSETTSKFIVSTAYNRKEAHGLYEKMGFDQSGYSYIFSYGEKGDF